MYIYIYHISYICAFQHLLKAFCMEDVREVGDFWEKRLREYLEKQKGWVAEEKE